MCVCCDCDCDCGNGREKKKKRVVNGVRERRGRLCSLVNTLPAVCLLATSTRERLRRVAGTRRETVLAGQADGPLLRGEKKLGI